MRSGNYYFAFLLVVLTAVLSNTLAFQVPATSPLSSQRVQRSDPASSQAATGPIGISFCQTITSPGDYLLLQDLTAPSPCIVIRNVTSVSLDCSGHSIFSTGVAPTVSVTDSTGVAISGCTARRSAEDGYALEVLRSSSVIVTNNDLEAVHIENDTNVQVLSNHILGAYYQLYTTAAVIENNDIVAYQDQSGACGICVLFGDHNQVLGNRIEGKWNGHLPVEAKGADDGIIVNVEHDDLIYGNVIQNVFDAGIETLGLIANTIFQNNQIRNAALTGIGAWFDTGWINNIVSGNQITDTYVAVYIFFASHSPVPDPATIDFENNRIENNVFTSPKFILGTTSYDNSINIFLVDPVTGLSALPVVAKNNTIANNFLPTYQSGPVLLPRSAFVDGGGNHCGQLRPGSPISCNSSPAQMPGARFVPITPCRIADTRNAPGPFGGPSLLGQASRDFAVPDSACGIPSTAVAYSLNVAVVPAASLGYLTLWPTANPQPLVATLNSDGRIKSSSAIVPAGLNGAVSVFVTDATDVILDINGYFVPPSNTSALAFYPLRPCRIADTRNAAAPLGGPSLTAQATRSFPIVSSSCGVPASAQAYSLNFAAVTTHPLGYLTAWPAGQPQPVVASLNDPTGTVAANAVIVPAGTNGAVNVFSTDAADLVIDINGYFASPSAGGLSLYTITPCRVIDTRLPAGSPPFNVTRDVSVTASPCGSSITVPAQAYVFNATAVPPGPLGYITVWPQGQSQPLAATLNATDGAVTNNMSIVPTTTGSISVFPSAPTHLVLDLFGYFAP